MDRAEGCRCLSNTHISQRRSTVSALPPATPEARSRTRIEPPCLTFPTPVQLKILCIPSLLLIAQYRLHQISKQKERGAKNGGPTGKPEGFIAHVVHGRLKLLLSEGLAKTLTARRSLTTGVENECFQRYMYPICVRVTRASPFGVCIGLPFILSGTNSQNRSYVSSTALSRGTAHPIGMSSDCAIRGYQNGIIRRRSTRPIF
jgi:hypothetical protein